MKAVLFLCVHCMFATWGVNSPSGCEVPLIQFHAEGWGTGPQSGLAVHVQAHRHHWRFGRHLQGISVPLWNWWKGTSAMFPGQSFSWCQQKGQQLQQLSSGRKGCTFPSLRNIQWQNKQGQAGFTQGHGNWDDCQLVDTSVVTSGFNPTLGLI